MSFYVIRYREGVPLKRRKHEHTVGRFTTYGQAFVAMVERPNSGDLEVQERQDAPESERAA